MLILLIHVGWTSGIYMLYILLELHSHLNWKDVFHTNLEVKATLVIHRVTLVIYTWIPECLSHTVLDQTRHKSTLWEDTSLHHGQVFSLGLNKCQTLPVPCTEVVHRLNVRGPTLGRVGRTSRGPMQPILLYHFTNSHNWWQYAIRNQKRHLSWWDRSSWSFC